jgi:hypothetical protein
MENAVQQEYMAKFSDPGWQILLSVKLDYGHLERAVCYQLLAEVILINKDSSYDVRLIGGELVIQSCSDLVCHSISFGSGASASARLRYDF